MRWHILKTLLHKEALRHATNRGGLALAGLLITASLLLAALNPAGNDRTSQLIAGIHHCFVHYDEDTDWTDHLQTHIPGSLQNHIQFRKMTPNTPLDHSFLYQTGTAAIEIRKLPDGPVGKDGKPKPRFRIVVKHPEGDRSGMAVYENWFWRETDRYFHQQARDTLKNAGINPDSFPEIIADDELWLQRLAHEELQQRFEMLAPKLESPIPGLEMKDSVLLGSALDLRAAIATALVMFALFFTCVYLMPSLTCEERERGLLLAQALSPASALEILAAKFLFYPAFGILLATLLAGIHNPAVLTRPFFWLALLSLAVGTLGIGMTIACLARTQRAASMGALCYMLAIALVLLICQQNNLTFLPTLALEYHAPHILHATLTDQIRPVHWLNLTACAILAAGWASMAVVLFRRRGWQ